MKAGERQVPKTLQAPSSLSAEETWQQEGEKQTAVKEF